MLRFSVVFNLNSKRLAVKFNESAKAFRVAFDSLQTATVRKDAEYYEGEYEITPTVEGEVLPTAHKLMQDDLTVKAIPVYSVGNTAGGNTFYIATMDDDPSGGRATLGKARLGAMVL